MKKGIAMGYVVLMSMLAACTLVLCNVGGSKLWLRGEIRALRQPDSQKQEFLRLLDEEKVDTVARRDLLEAVLDVQRWCQQRGLDFAVVLFPTKRSLLRADGIYALEKPNDACRQMMATARAIDAEGVRVVNLLPEAYKLAFKCERPQTLFCDDCHYTNAYMSDLSEKMPEELFRRERITIFGDCFSLSLDRALRAHYPKIEFRSFGRNGGAHRVPQDIVLFPSIQVEEGETIWWVLEDFVLMKKEVVFPRLSPIPAIQLFGVDEWIIADLDRCSTVDPKALKGSPYLDAIVIHRFVDERGSAFLACVKVLEQRQLIEEVLLWKRDDRMQMRRISWERACTIDPELLRIQLLDDIQDYSAPMFWIEDWRHTSKDS